MDKFSDQDHDTYIHDEPPVAKKVEPVVVGLAILGGLVLLPIVSGVLAIALKLTLGLLAGAIGLAAGLLSLALGLTLGAMGLALGMVGAVAGFLITPPGLVLIALVVWAKSER